MINENKELIITTAEAFEILRIINKLNMKEEIMSVLDSIVRLNSNKESKYSILKELVVKKVGKEEYNNMHEADKVEATEEVLNKNTKLKDELTDINSEINKVGMSCLYDFLARIPQAEKEVNKCLARIFEKDIKEIAIQSPADTKIMIMQIVQDKGVVGFFK